ncbi:MAG TPA: anti-sigma factor [Thermoanaerobaculia bacterium]|nr:anti-sigma factor [Thermoanaerobaculia bacterium]
MHEEFENLAALVALGAATAEEQSALAEHNALCQECDRSRIAYENASAAFALALDPVVPPLDLGRKVMRSLVRDAEEKEGEERSQRLIPAWWLATAATFFMALFGWSELRLRAAREQISEIQATSRSLDEDNRRLAEKNQSMSARMQSMAGVEMIAMKPMPPAPKATGRAFMDPVTHRAVVVLANLPMSEENRCYQLWIMPRGSSTPVSAGTFEVHDSRGTEMMEIRDLPTDFAGLAVTAEPRGGMPAPTGEKYLAGFLS